MQYLLLIYSAESDDANQETRPRCRWPTTGAFTQVAGSCRAAQFRRPIA